MKLSAFCLALLTVTPLAADLTPDQREADLTSLANYIAKYYVPANWKMVALGVNPLDLRRGDYLRRARQAPNDLAYFEVVQEYVASFRDGHTDVYFPSTFVADLGIRVDIYDGKPLLDSVNRTLYPLATFPALAIGNEIISIDGVPVATLMEKVAKLYLLGSGRASQRYGAVYLGFRPQSILPFSIDLPDESDVVVETPDGKRETLRLKWTKTGTPVRSLGRGVNPIIRTAAKAHRSARAEDDFLAKTALDAAPDFLLQPRPFPRETLPELSGFGGRVPYFTLPANFVIRRGRTAADFTYSGTYLANGLRIGYLRIPNFSPANVGAAITEVRGEIAYLKANTDGLVLDTSHNNGGSPNFGAELMSILTTSPYYLAPRQYLPGVRDVTSYDSFAESLRAFNAPGWVLDRWQTVGDQFRQAFLSGGRALTGPVSVVIPSSESSLFRGPLLDDNPPLRVNNTLLGYDKPTIVLIDDFSVSHGEIFPANFQDNARGLLVGYRTAGMGASIECTTDIMPFSEFQYCNSFSLVMRRNPVRSPEFPAAPYVENIGVFPDVEIDFQTKENLLNQGRPFVAAFTQVIVDQIRKGQ